MIILFKFSTTQDYHKGCLEKHLSSQYLVPNFRAQ